MSKTIENLAKAFIGESQARNRYTMYSSITKKEGYEKIGEVFQITADNEFEHAEWLFKMINQLKAKEGGNLDEIKVDAAAPTILGKTIDNLKSAIAGEHYENSSMYPEFAAVADKEGYADVAKRLRSIIVAEQHHEERYKNILKEVAGGTFFKKKEKVQWFCRKCGYVHTGNEPPEKCPLCEHERSFYELKCECF